MAALLGMFIILISIGQIKAQDCGSQAGFAYCSPGNCCSQYGYCGTTSAYCGDGCQSQCNQEVCGIQANLANCSSSSGCCSEYGFCGTSSAYCGDGCQSGACSGAPVTPVKLGYWYADSSPASNINSCLYTHLLYAFASMDPSSFSVQPPSYDNGQISSFVSTVRQSNPNVKTLLSIGGGSSNSTAFSSMVSSSSSRSAFINSSVALARQYNFDGLDLDWEYPSTSTDMSNLGLLFEEWHSYAPDLLLAAAVYYTNPLASWLGGASYPTSSIQSSLDWVLVMSYDFHGSWESYTNPPAALYDSSNPTINGDYGFMQWLQSLPMGKVLYGLPAYGHAWNLSDPSNHGTGAPAVGSSTSLGDTPTYAQIASFLSSSGAIVVHNTTSLSTYAYSGITWVGYDDSWSITRKVNYLKSKGMRGYGFWTVLSDDSNFTLAKAAAKALDGKYCNGTTISTTTG